MMMIKGGHVIDPGNLNGIFDIYIKNGVIESVVPSSDSDKTQTPTNTSANIPTDTIDASGKIVTPGLIDMHVHLREPGHEYKETIESGCHAAVAGGFTAVCSMPNTNPVNDNSEITSFIIKKAKEAGFARVYPVAAISHGISGKSLTEFSDLKNAGAIAVSDDGRPVINDQLMRRAMEYAKGFNLLVISHSENLELTAGGSMNEGPISTRMGLAGIPNAAESVMVMRDIALCELTSARLHIAHVSTHESVRAIRDAKNRSVPVTAETAPHYFTLTDETVSGYRTNAKMNPPLRSQKDVEAIKEGLADGTIDVIATDHAPHSTLEKDVEFDKAANGIIGLETSLPLSLALVRDGVLQMETLIEKMSKNPGRILGLNNKIEKGQPADLTIIDAETEYDADPDAFFSFSRNTPFAGMKMKGRAAATIVNGCIVFRY
ncbi:MAG: dihydroorotase [Deltaproteobacteria bacterium]|nr:dihydroorotase [Deltaproteobacteria bacterium]